MGRSDEHPFVEQKLEILREAVEDLRERLGILEAVQHSSVPASPPVPAEPEPTSDEERATASEDLACETVRCRRIEIADGSDRVRVELHADDAEPKATFFDRQGRPRLRIRVAFDGAPEVELLSAAGDPVASMRADANGHPTIEVRGPDGGSTATLAIGERRLVSFRMGPAAGPDSVSMVSFAALEADGSEAFRIGEVSVVTADGSRQASLYADGGSACVGIGPVDEVHRVGFIVSSARGEEPEEAVAFLNDARGATRIKLQVRGAADAAQLALFDEDEDARIVASAANDEVLLPDADCLDGPEPDPEPDPEPGA